MNAGWGLLTDLGYVLQQLTDVTNQLFNEGRMEFWSWILFMFVAIEF